MFFLTSIWRMTTLNIKRRDYYQMLECKYTKKREEK